MFIISYFPSRLSRHKDREWSKKKKHFYDVDSRVKQFFHSTNGFPSTSLRLHLMFRLFVIVPLMFSFQFSYLLFCDCCFPFPLQQRSFLIRKIFSAHKLNCEIVLDAQREIKFMRKSFDGWRAQFNLFAFDFPRTSFVSFPTATFLRYFSRLIACSAVKADV